MTQAGDFSAELLDAALNAVSQGNNVHAEKLYGEIIDRLEKLYGNSQKDVAAELQRIAKAMESKGQSSDAFEFKQRTCELLLKRSMAQRHRGGAPPTPSASSPQSEPPMFKIAQPISSAPIDTPFEKIEYVCLFARDFKTELAYYLDNLGASQAWAAESSAAHFAALRMAAGPLLLLTDHAEAKDLKTIFGARDIEKTLRELKSNKCHAVKAGFNVDRRELYLFRDPAGNVHGVISRVT